MATSLACLGLFLLQRIWAQVGIQVKPSLLAWPSSVVPLGQYVNLCCQAHNGSYIFSLYKSDGPDSSRTERRIFQSSYLLGPVIPEHAGTYRCRGFYPQPHSLWTPPSDALVIVVTGLYRKPTLSAQQGPVVTSGDNVTLVCSSESPFDKFHLSRDGEVHGASLTGGQRHDRTLQAHFHLNFVSATHEGTYRCYGSLNHSPYRWSEPSDPLNISVTAPAPQDHTVGNSIRMGVGGLVLLLLLAVLVQSWGTRERSQWEIWATVLNPKSQLERMEPPHSVSFAS